MGSDVRRDPARAPEYGRRVTSSLTSWPAFLPRLRGEPFPTFFQLITAVFNQPWKGPSCSILPSFRIPDYPPGTDISVRCRNGAPTPGLLLAVLDDSAALIEDANVELCMSMPASSRSHVPYKCLTVVLLDSFTQAVTCSNAELGGRIALRGRLKQPREPASRSSPNTKPKSQTVPECVLCGSKMLRRCRTQRLDRGTPRHIFIFAPINERRDTGTIHFTCIPMANCFLCVRHLMQYISLRAVRDFEILVDGHSGVSLH
jgi:hypothetical protein